MNEPITFIEPLNGPILDVIKNWLANQRKILEGLSKTVCKN